MLRSAEGLANLTRKTGNLIAANDSTPLVTINQISPVFATFSAPEQSLANSGVIHQEENSRTGDPPRSHFRGSGRRDISIL